MNSTPRWLSWLERKASWLAIPQIAILFITLQCLGFGAVMTDPAWAERLALFPSAVLQGHEYWRVITFLSLPVATSPLWLFFFLWFQYFVFSSLEAEWGDFKTTFYVLVSILLTNAYSLLLDYPVAQASHFASSVFLASAMLFPEREISLYFVVQVKMKWLAFLSIAFVLFEAYNGSWLDRGHLAAIYSGFILFFGPGALSSIKNAVRRAKYKRQLRG